jgi:MFS family permease
MVYGVTLFVMSPLQSYVAAARGKLSMGRALTLISACFNLGAVIGPWLGGQIGDQMGLRQTYYIAGSIFIVSTLVILFIRPQPVEAVTHSEKANGWIFSKRYLVYMGVIFLAIFAMYLPQPLTPNYLTNQGGLNLSRIGSLYSIASIGVVVLNLTLGALPARVGFLLGQAAVGLFALIIWRGTGLTWYVPAFFLLGGFKTAKALGMAQVRELVPSARMGLAFGLSETVAAMAVILAPLLAGYLYTFEPRMMYLVGASLIVVSLGVSAVFSPKHTQANKDAQAIVQLDMEIEQGP